MHRVELAFLHANAGKALPHQKRAEYRYTSVLLQGFALEDDEGIRKIKK